jgi:uncharacterized SAM-binding protein YcdF (DUF218 family)
VVAEIDRGHHAGLLMDNLVDRTAARQGMPTIVVFGAAVAADGTPSAALARRLEAALRAAAAFPASPVLVTGGAVHSHVAEAPVMAASLRDAGVARERLIVEDQARTTWESTGRIARLIADRGDARAVVLVTSGYHAPRCRLFLRLAGIAVVTAITPPDERRRMGAQAWMVAVAREFAAMPWNVLRVLWSRLS